jgi:hypothetical protein
MRHRRAAGRPDGTAALDRTPQILPIPLGGLTPVRRRSSVVLRRFRRHESTALLALACVATGGAVWLSTSSRSFTVEMTASGLRVDDLVLTASTRQSVGGMRVFTGQASVALAVVESGSMRAAAVMTLNGVEATGQCESHVLSTTASETCQFKSGGAGLTSTATFDFGSRTWDRRYSDGIEVTIMVPRGSELIPIPFPLGH